MGDFTVKDSGARAQFGCGMVRDTEEGKPDYTLVADGPMLERWAVHLTKGAKKYDRRNWMKAADGTDEEIRAVMERFQRSSFRHYLQWLRGDRDEDHGAGVFFNINGYEFLLGVLETRAKARRTPVTTFNDSVGDDLGLPPGHPDYYLTYEGATHASR